MVLLAAIHRFDEFGVWLAGSVAAFTLVHELAHALVARWAGAEAEISLEFMAGFTSYSARRQLPRPWTIAISLAGPLVHVAVGVSVLVALGGSPLDRPSLFESERVAAVWWAGLMIGLFNLIPVLPLDGGHATMTVLDRFIPGKAERVMLYGSVAVTVGAMAASPFVDRMQGLTIFIGFLLLIQLQALFSYRGRHAVSPFDEAARALRAGDRRKAESIITKTFTRRAPLVERVADLSTAPSEELGQLIAYLPRPFPRGHPANDYLLTVLLIRFGRARDAAEYAAEGFALEPGALPACGVARAAAALDDGQTAAAWLRTALDRGLSFDEVRALVDSPAFATVRGHRAIQLLFGPGGMPTAAPRLT